MRIQPEGAQIHTISFDTNGGNALYPGTLTTSAEGKLSVLPIPTRSGSYRFEGWFTAASSGTKVTTSTVFNTNSTIYAHWTYQGGGSGGGGGGTPSVPTPEPGQTISDQSITTTDNGTKVDLTQGGTKLTLEQTASIISSNQNQPVQIQGQGFTITFPKGSMSEVPGQSTYDFGLEITTLTGQSGSVAQGQNQQAQAMLALADGSGVMALSFKHSGPLPGTASIEINVGKEYTGQTLYYYYYNPNTKALEFRQAAQVDESGKLIITQDRCSDYLLSTTLLGIEAKDRIWGQNRYLTAVNIAKEYFKEGASTVILARGDSSVDALPAVPLAKHYNAPLLLTPSAKLPGEVLEQIKALKAQKVVLIGGTGAISTEIAEVLKEKGLEVERISGINRYETAYEIAKKLNSVGVNKEKPTAILVNGNRAEATYADALSISPWAGYNGIPILYGDSTNSSLPKATARSFKELGITKTILIGGVDVLPAGLEKSIPNPERYSGADRFATNAAILKGLQEKPVNVYAVTGLDYADALAVAAVAAWDNSWLILTGAKGTSEQVQNGLTKEQQQLLSEQKGLLQYLRVFGGQSAITDETLAYLKALVGK
ncbi:cell wall-binding repeat-containing protein [Desulfitobacterium sp. THU1]|uniref:cell wall-binding repeat-containing protein n=1 Tax=Desulfitobacterium sp. THU1 TaxID=3138072 RepID=UPI00311E2592